MAEAASYSAVETLRDGLRVEIRALRPDDREAMLSAVAGTSPQSLYRRFFTPKRGFSEREIAFFMNVDFVEHVALVAVTEETGEPVVAGGGRYFVTSPRQAEVAFVVVDRFQRRGVGRALMRHFVAIARAAGLEELTAEVLAENAPMLKVFKECGLPMTMRRESEVVHVTLRL